MAHAPTGQTTNVSVTSGNPSAIGLLGLSMVTLVAASQKLGITDGTSLVIPWAIFLGAIAQIYAGAIDLKLNNVFGATAFFGYGLFWLGVASTWAIQHGVFGESMQASADPRQLGFAFIGYLIFTLIMTVAATETNKFLLIDFILIDFLFIGLACSTLGFMPHFFHNLAAYVELAISLVSFYGVAANVMNATFGYEFLPVGKPLGIFKKPATTQQASKAA